MKISKNGIDFLAEWEEFRSKMYNCPAGHCTIGYGTLIHYGKIDGRDSEKPYVTGITREKAMELLLKEISTVEKQVEKIFQPRLPLKENENDALISFVFNAGYGNIRSLGPGGGWASVVVKINSGAKPEDFRPNWLAWCHAGGREMPGLKKRRIAEWRMFAEGVYLKNE